MILRKINNQSRACPADQERIMRHLSSNQLAYRDRILEKIKKYLEYMPAWKQCLYERIDAETDEIIKRIPKRKEVRAYDFFSQKYADLLTIDWDKNNFDELIYWSSCIPVHVDVPECCNGFTVQQSLPRQEEYALWKKHRRYYADYWRCYFDPDAELVIRKTSADDIKEEAARMLDHAAETLAAAALSGKSWQSRHAIAAAEKIAEKAAETLKNPDQAEELGDWLAIDRLCEEWAKIENSPEYAKQQRQYARQENINTSKKLCVKIPERRLIRAGSYAEGDYFENGFVITGVGKKFNSGAGERQYIYFK